MKRRSSSSCGVNRILETSSFSKGTPMPLRATRSSTAAQPKKKLDYTSETKKIVKKSKTTSENYTSDKDEFGIHRHVGEDKKFGKNAHEMKVEAGEEVPPRTELVRKNHTVTVPETLARQQSTSDESDAVSETGSTATGPSRHQPNVAYIEYHNVDLNKSNASSLCRNLDMDVDMRMSRMEEIMETLKQDLAELKRGMDAILRVYGIDPVTLQPMDPPATCREHYIHHESTYTISGSIQPEGANQPR